MKIKYITGLMSLFALNSYAQDMSHSYVVKTRNANGFFADQRIFQGKSETMSAETIQSAFGFESFGFWRNSVTTNILHKYLYTAEQQRTFLVGNGFGFETKLVFSSPMVNIGMYGGGTLNIHKIPADSDKRVDSTTSYAGLSLERFLSYRVAVGATIRSSQESFDREKFDMVDQQTNEVGVFISLWDRP